MQATFNRIGVVGRSQQRGLEDVLRQLLALLEARGFTADDFAFSHPGGTLGKKLLLKVEDVMRSGAAIPQVEPDTPLSEALLEISNKGLGMTTVLDKQGQLAGIFTDGDLRRLIERGVRFVQLYHRGWDHHGGVKNGVATTAKLVTLISMSVSLPT